MRPNSRALHMLLLVARSAFSMAAVSCLACPAGTGGPCGGPCVDCSAGTYRDARGNASCAACPANSGASCLACRAESECLCNAGYTDTGVCTACIPGKYKSGAGSAACTHCATGTYSSADAGSTTCVPCPLGTGQHCDEMNVDPATGYGCSAESQCRCNDGAYGPDGGPCAACPAASGNSCVSWYAVPCRDISDCSCNDGMYGTAGACAACPPDASSWCFAGYCLAIEHCYDGTY